MAEGPLDVALRVAAVLDELGLPYVLGGSLASSLVGEPRATADVDLAIRSGEEDISLLVRALESEFYVNEAAALDAVRRRTSFNLVHHVAPPGLARRAAAARDRQRLLRRSRGRRAR